MRVALGFVTAKLDGEAGYTARLRALFAVNLALLDEYPKHVPALSHHR